MANCQRPGCTNPIPQSKTRPQKYCSGKCREAHRRIRKAALKSAGVDFLIDRAQKVVLALDRYRAAPTPERFQVLHRRINDLADVPLLVGKDFRVIEELGSLTEVPEQTLPGIVLANATGQGGGPRND